MIPELLESLFAGTSLDDLETLGRQRHAHYPSYLGFVVHDQDVA